MYVRERADTCCLLPQLRSIHLNLPWHGMAWTSGLMLAMIASVTPTVSKQLHVTWLSKLVRWKPGHARTGAHLTYVSIQLPAVSLSSNMQSYNHADRLDLHDLG